MSIFPDTLTRAEANALHCPPTDQEGAHRWAVGRLTDGEEYCLETFAEWVATLDWTRKPLLVKQPRICGATADAELVKLLLQADDDGLILATVRELRARYLADEYTQRCIAGEVDVYLGSVR